MPVKSEGEDVYLRVIGRSLAYLCLRQVEQAEPKRFPNLLEKVKFLTDLGLPEADAAYAVGSTPESIRVQRSQRKGGRNARK